MKKKKFLLFLIICNVLLIIVCLYKLLIENSDSEKLILLFAGILSLINAIISLKNSGKNEKIGFWKYNVK